MDSVPKNSAPSTTNLCACGVNWAPASRSPPNRAQERSRGEVELGSYCWMDYLVAELLLNSWSFGLCCCDCSTQLLREQSVEHTSCFTLPPPLPPLNTVVLMVADSLFSLYRLEHKDELFPGTWSPLYPIGFCGCKAAWKKDGKKVRK